jgi:hypothetical protein
MMEEEGRVEGMEVDSSHHRRLRRQHHRTRRPESRQAMPKGKLLLICAFSFESVYNKIKIMDFNLK